MRIAYAKLVLMLVLSGCAGGAAQLQPGRSTEADVRRKMGAPSEVYEAADGSKRLAYATGPLGVRTFMAQVSRDGALQRFEQVLDEDHFAQIIRGRTTRAEVRQLIGPPTFVYADGRPDRSWWEYRFRDAWGYTAEFTAIFDANGVVVDKVILRLDDRSGERSKR
jgi:outer membrane protein assembly factor BamE (lipoprotein component of BamABCDE complex)